MAPQAKVYSAKGKELRAEELPEAIFGKKVKTALLHETVRWQRAKKRAGTHATKTRATASGGGVKPWKQKGTGRARAGSNTSPLWVGGGIAHGPKPRSHEFSLNRRQRRSALVQALSARAQEGKIIVVDDFGLKGIKTKQAQQVLNALGIAKGESTLVVLSDGESVLEKSLRNIDRVQVTTTAGVNVYTVLGAKYLVLTSASLEAVKQGLSA